MPKTLTERYDMLKKNQSKMKQQSSKALIYQEQYNENIRDLGKSTPQAKDQKTYDNSIENIKNTYDMKLNKLKEEMN